MGLRKNRAKSREPSRWPDAVRRATMTVFTGPPMKLLLLLYPLIFLALAPAQLAPVPPMGWNSWNHFAERVNDKVIRETADAIVASGMRDAGYIYINIDDTWEG